MISSICFEHDRANAWCLSRGKPVSTLGSSPRACFSGSCSTSRASIATLSHIGGFALRLGVEPRLRPAQALLPRPHYNFPKRQQDYRYDKWKNIIEDAKQQHSREQLFPVQLPQADQHGGVEHTEP